MRPVDNVVTPVDVHAQRKDRAWRRFFLTLVGIQALVIIGLDASIWWVLGGGVVALACHEGYFWLSGRMSS